MDGHHPRRTAAAALGIGLAVAGSPAAAEAPEANAAAAGVFAERMTRESAARLQVGGSDAVGGVGDWAFGNGTLCAVVSDPSHEATLTVSGGVLVDLGHCGRADDQFGVLHTLVNFSRKDVLAATEVVASAKGDRAVVTTRGEERGLALETRYVLDRAHPRALKITTRLERRAEGDWTFLFGDVTLHGGRQLAPFTLSLRGTPAARAAGSVGFAHPPVDVDDPIAMVSAILPADLHVLVGSDALEPGIAYGLRIVSAHLESGGRALALPHLAINGADFSLLGVFMQPFWFGGDEGIGWLELAQLVLMDLDLGEALVFEREIVVGDRADVASVTDQLWPDAARVSGRLDDPAARLHVFAAREHETDDARPGQPTTQLRPGADGAFALRLPPGRYRAEVRAPARGPVDVSFTVDEADVDLGVIATGAAGRVVLPRLRPMRLVFVPEDAQTPVVFGDDLHDFRVGAVPHGSHTQARDVSLAGIEADPLYAMLPPGAYEVIASRGPEFSLARSRLVVRAGQDAHLEIDSPSRVLEPRGWLSADLHVHAQWSDDSGLPIAARLAAFAAQGADVVVATEHDHLRDWAPSVTALGLADRLKSIVGVEVTATVHGGDAPHTLGHANAYPLLPDPLAYRGGAPRAEGRRLRALVADVRARGGLVQLNHPRSRTGELADQSFLTHLSIAGTPFRPELPLSSESNRSLIEPRPGDGLRDLDFDVLELMNGDSLAQYRATRADWYALLLQGEFRVAVANSDSHVLAEPVAVPRTYVRPDASALLHETGFDESAFVAGLRAGRAYGTTGPLLECRLVGAGVSAGIGELFSSREGVLELRVRTAPWVTASDLVVRVDAASAIHRAVTPGTLVRLPLAFDRDAFVTVEVRGEPSDDYAKLLPGFEPRAFTNPIFVDADGDGRWTAPGLPAAPPPVITSPHDEPPLPHASP